MQKAKTCWLLSLSKETPGWGEVRKEQRMIQRKVPPASVRVCRFGVCFVSVCVGRGRGICLFGFCFGGFYLVGWLGLFDFYLDPQYCPESAFWLWWPEPVVSDTGVENQVVSRNRRNYCLEKCFLLLISLAMLRRLLFVQILGLCFSLCFLIGKQILASLFRSICLYLLYVF